jgi:3-hydroxyanthranilate 3,4-dioxygenase
MQVRDVQKPLEPFNLMQWIERNKHRLIPPVSNETIYKGNDTFIVMVSGGPNARKDYHYNESEELFFQLKGDIQIGLYVNGQHKTIDVREGQMVLIPPKVAHQPRRFANTVGLIIEKHRVPGEKDGFLYFCDNCGNLLYEEYFFLEDIVKQFPMVMRNFYGSLERRTCKKCGTVMELPPNWEQSIAARAQDNEYAKDPYAKVHGKSW